MPPDFFDDRFANPKTMSWISVCYQLKKGLGRDILLFPESEDKLVAVKNEQQAFLPKAQRGFCGFPL